MPFASSAFGQIRYTPETTYNVTPVTGNAVNLRMVTPSMKAAVANVMSQEIRTDRLSTGQVRTDLNIDGGFNLEFSGKEYDPFLESVMGNVFTHYGTLGLGTSFSMSSTSSSITAAAAPTGTSAFTSLVAGSWFKVVPPTAASAAVKEYFNDKWFKVGPTPTATSITLDAMTPIAAPGIVTSTVGYAISQSTSSNGSVVKSFSMEYAMTDILQTLTFTGMRASTFELSVEVGALITGSFGFIGGGHTIQSGSLLPTTSVLSQTLDVMNAVTDVGAIYEAGSSLLSSNSFIKGVKFNINNNLRGQKAVSVYGNAGVGVGELQIGGTLEVYFQDATYYNKWLNGTSTSLVIGMADAAGNGYLIEMDKVQFSDGALNPGGRSEDVMLSLPFSAFYSPLTGRGLRITRAVAA